MRGRVLAHHAGGDDEEAPAGKFHRLGLAVFEHDEVECLAQLEVAVPAVGAMGFEVVDLGEHAAQAADVDGLGFQAPGAGEQGQQREDFLRPPQRERGDQHAGLAFERALNGLAEPLNFRLAGEARRHRAVAARGFHDEHVRLYAPEARALQDGLIVERHIAGVKQSFLLPADHQPGGAERVASVEESRVGEENPARVL